MFKLKDNKLRQGQTASIWKQPNNNDNCGIKIHFVSQPDITEFKDFIGGQAVVDARAKLTFLNLLSNSNASAIAATCESPQISARS
jgi:hypothetical protein